MNRCREWDKEQGMGEQGTWEHGNMGAGSRGIRE